jgi:cell division protein FtsI/penicillin-binding protein 2
VSQRAANRRIRLVGVVLTLALAGTLIKAAWVQVGQAGSLARRANAQQTGTITIPASRGSIFDRSGVELATNSEAITVFADPKYVRAPAAEVIRAARVLDLNETGQEQLLAALSDRSKRFVYVARQAPVELANRLKRLKLAGFGFYPEPKRTYPQNTLAPQVIGFADTDNRGIAGLEKTYEKALSGRDGYQTVIRDPAGRVIDVLSNRDEEPGADLTLALDNVIQLGVQRVLRQTLVDQRASSASAVVLDARSGAVLAMATVPTYNANNVSKVSAQYQRNRAVTDNYEPGSTFKLVTVAGALSDRDVTPQTKFILPYSIDVADKTIHDAHPRGTEQRTVAEILTLSSNVGVVRISQMLGEERLARWIRAFGFGKQTGIDFPGESSGDVRPLDEWYGSAVGTIPIGQGIAITSLQLAAAYAAIANDGVWVQPHLVERIGTEAAAAPKRRRVVSSQVAAQLMTMLRNVVDEGTGTLAEVPNYTVAGKTGTAAKPDPTTGGYSSYRYVASFVGIVPASKPRLVILVTVDEPHGSIWGGVAAAPAFKQIALDCLRYLEIAPDRVAESG